MTPSVAKRRAAPRGQLPPATEGVFVAILKQGQRLNQLEGMRITAEGQLRSFRKQTAGAFPQDEEMLEEGLAKLRKKERDAITLLERAVERSPFGPWIEARFGVGKKSVGRLLAEIGYPTIDARGDGSHRTLEQLFSFCGVGDAATQKRRKGRKINWNPAARKALHNIAEPAFMNNPRYSAIYKREREKLKAASKVHQSPCRNSIYSPPSVKGARPTNGCGTEEHPEWGDPGSPWRPAHQHQHALRLVGRAFLADLHAEAALLQKENA